MSFFGSMDIAASGMTAQRLRLDIISENLANAEVTRTQDGGPYKRKSVLLEGGTHSSSFDQILASKGNSLGVRVSAIIEDESDFPIVYNPGHPDADENGYVQMPNVNTVEEMTDMISASRAYESNITAFNTMKAMATKALQIGQG